MQCMCVCAQLLSHVRLFETSWTVSHQAPLSIGFSRQEYWNGCHFLLQGIFLTQGSNPCLLCLQHRQVGSLPLLHLGSSSWVHPWIQITKYQGAVDLHGNVIGLIRDLLSLIPRRISIRNQFPFWSISSIRNMCIEHCTRQTEWFLVRNLKTQGFYPHQVIWQFWTSIS